MDRWNWVEWKQSQNIMNLMKEKIINIDKENQWTYMSFSDKRMRKKNKCQVKEKHIKKNKKVKVKDYIRVRVRKRGTERYKEYRRQRGAILECERKRN